MIKKNKDGSYNKFQLIVVMLIAIISIFIISTLLIQNIQLPWDQKQNENPIKLNNTTNSINTDGLYWVETDTYGKEGGGGGSGYYTLIDPSLNKTYVPMGVNTTYYTNDGGEGKTYSINNTIAYVMVAGGGGHGEGNPISNLNDTYIYCNKDECNTTITSWDAPINATITYFVVGGGGGSHYINSAQNTNTTFITTQPTTIQSYNTSQNLTIMTSIINIIDTFPTTIWILLIFIFGITITSSKYSSNGILFSITLIMILWWLNIIQINNILTFILPVLFIYICIKMLFPRR